VRPSSLVRAKLRGRRNRAGQVGCLPNPTREKSGGFLGLPACVHPSGLRFLRRFDLPEPFSATAWRTSDLNADSSTSSPSWMSIARRTFPSRLELNRRAGSFRDAPLAKAPPDQNICRIHIIFRQGFYVEGVICRIRANCCPSRRTIFTFC